jgi:hypothetical protein
MQNLTIHLGSATPLSSRAGPRAPAPADKPAPPVSGTTAQHCVAAHPSAPSLPALSGRHARATHVARERRARAAAGQRLPVGARPHGTPAPCGTPPPRLGPPPFPSSFPSAALPTSRSLPARAAPLVPPSLLLSDPSSQVPELPHRSPHLDRRLRPPAAPLPRGFRPSTAAVRHSPVSSSPSYQSPKFLADPSVPHLSRATGLHHPCRRPPEPPPRQ